MGPNLEKIISRSSSVVTGLSLQTNKTSSGGATSASGMSPNWCVKRCLKVVMMLREGCDESKLLDIC